MGETKRKLKDEKEGKRKERGRKKNKF